MTRTFAATFLGCLLALTAPAVSHAARGDCGQPVSTGTKPSSADCLFILKAAIAAEECIPLCVCDTTGDASITAGDALLCLKVAVGQAINLMCTVPCPTVTTSTSTTSSSTSSSTSTVTFPTTTTTVTGATSSDAAQSDDAVADDEPERKNVAPATETPGVVVVTTFESQSDAEVTSAAWPGSAPKAEMCSLEL